jgi:hypothetical protein
MIEEDGMKRSFLFQLFGIFTLIGLILAVVGTQPVLAKHYEPQESAKPLVKMDVTGQVELTFAELRMTSPQTLNGPVSEYAIKFNLPVNWKPMGMVRIDLDLSAFFSSLMPTDSSSSVSGLVGGDLSVYLNDSLVEVKTLQQSGAQTIQLEFNSALLTFPVRGSYNELRIRWDGSISCQMNLLSSVTIMPASKISFSYVEDPGPLSLNDFPAPFIIENSIRPVPLAVILPDSPSLSEIRAALIIVAGIGQISKGNTPVELVTLSEYLISSKPHPNVIVVATQDHITNPNFELLKMRTKIGSGQGEGTLQFFELSTANYGILVTGDEAGIIKAAQVLGAKQVVAAGDALTMIISAVNPTAPSYSKEDMTLEDLGVGEMVFTYQNGLDQSFEFFMPAGEQARTDASFNLIFSHSQQLDYLRSGLQVKLNGFPAISFRLMDSTSNQTLFTVILPSNLIHPGRNTVELVANLKTRDLCTAPVESIAWMRVSASSTLHIPLESAITSTGAPKTFKDFPDLFLSGSGLDNVIFVLSPADFGNIQAAGKLAYRLGAALPQAQTFQLKVNFSNAVETALTNESNVILVGKPLDFNTLSTTEEFPSLVFNPDNTLSEASTLTMVTKPAASADVGYLAIRGFDTQSSQILMAVLGNSPTAISNAVDTVTNLDVRTSNFAYVVGNGVQISWLDQGIATGELAPSANQTTPVPPGASTSQEFRQGMLIWVVPTLVALSALLVFFVFIEIRQQIRKD